MKTTRDQASLFGYISPVTGDVSSHPPLCACGSCSMPVERFEAATVCVERCEPFKVRASCGHIVIRKMREATAGVPYTPETIIEAPNGRPCDECERRQP